MTRSYANALKSDEQLEEERRKEEEEKKNSWMKVPEIPKLPGQGDMMAEGDMMMAEGDMAMEGAM